MAVTGAFIFVLVLLFMLLGVPVAFAFLAANLVGAFLLMGANVFFFQSHGILKHFPEAGFARETDSFSDGMVDILLNGMVSKPGRVAEKEEGL